MNFASYQPVDVLMLVGNIAPIAVYLLALGLANSHARPHLITARADFVALTSVLVPVLLWPVPNLARGHTAWLLVVGFVVAAIVFWHLLPSRNAGFVVYNISEARCMQLLDQTLYSMELSGRWRGRTWRSRDGRLTLQLHSFGLLRNVSIAVDTQPPDEALVDALAQGLAARIRQVAQLPSTMGACLVLLGIGLLVVPMWMVGRHIHDLVDAMSHLFG